MSETKVLIVEDSLDTAQTLAHLLRDSGHKVEYAINGRAALSIAERLQPKVVLLDLTLPDFDGFTLARRLRRVHGMEDVRIVAITGRVSDDDEERAVEAGCERLLRKPAQPDAVIRVIEDEAS